MSLLPTQEPKQQCSECVVKYFEFKRMKNHLKTTGDTFKSERFSSTSGHPWRFQLKRLSHRRLAARLCPVTQTDHDIVANFSVQLKRTKDVGHQGMEKSGVFDFSGTKRKSEWFCFPINFSKDEFKIRVTVHSHVHSRCESTESTSAKDEDVRLETSEAVRADIDKKLREFLSFLKNGNLHDAVIQVGDEEIKCHKSVLAWRSPRLFSMIERGASEDKDNNNRIEITESDPQTVKAMIDFLYTFECPKLPLEPGMVLLKTAVTYDIPDLKDACEKNLVSEMNSSNAMDVLLYADMYSAHKVKKRAVDFIWENMASFKKLEQYKPLMLKPDLLCELMMAKANAAK